MGPHSQETGRLAVELSWTCPKLKSPVGRADLSVFLCPVMMSNVMIVSMYLGLKDEGLRASIVTSSLCGLE